MSAREAHDLLRSPNVAAVKLYRPVLSDFDIRVQRSDSCRATRRSAIGLTMQWAVRQEFVGCDVSGYAHCSGRQEIGSILEASEPTVTELFRAVR